ncbi:MAG: aminoacyl-histidine dipeptidase [Bacteroidales bacterium]|nr:aminoacyl-histidine dipeptidase [Bacteroidales bacterium]
MNIGHLEPAGLWSYFEEICRIPRLSKKEGKIIEFLEGFAADHNLECKRDKTGNILIRKPASPGLENLKPVVLQSHMDMVGEKDSDTLHNWDKDPITPVIKGDWVKAVKTTLGADDGIGIAAQLLILSDTEIKTGPVECLFTVDEESGMTGAKNIQPGFFNSRILINLDSEDEGELFIGCSGGIDTIATMTFSEEKSEKGMDALSLSLTGLSGGHSGDEIHRGFGNSVKIMNRLLLDIDSMFGIRISTFNGGNLRNAIPREAFATITFNADLKDKIIDHTNEFGKKISSEYRVSDPSLTLTVGNAPLPGTVVDRSRQEKMNMALEKCPHGVIAWSETMEDLVETSTNLASIKFAKDNTIRIVTSQRSSSDSAKEELSTRIERIFRESGAEVYHPDGYPGWQPDTNSEILRITKESYLHNFGSEPVVRAIHAGLECGLFLEKFPGLDMISFGPTIKGAHTPEERISIKSTVRFWTLLTDLLTRIPAEN